MANFADARSQPTAAASEETILALDCAVDAYLGARADARESLEAVLAVDPDCVMAHCLDGYFRMLSSKREATEHAVEASARAKVGMERERVRPREQLQVAALGAWSRGDMRSAVRHWDSLLAAYPRDIVAIKVSQFVLSYLGESER